MLLEDVVDARFSKVLPNLKPHGAQGAKHMLDTYPSACPSTCGCVPVSAAARPEIETAVFTFTRVPSATRTGKCVKILVVLKPSTSVTTNTR